MLKKAGTGRRQICKRLIFEHYFVFEKMCFKFFRTGVCVGRLPARAVFFRCGGEPEDRMQPMHRINIVSGDLHEDADRCGCEKKKKAK